MAITVEQAVALRRSMRDVFVPNGDAGVVVAVSAKSLRAMVNVAPSATHDAGTHWYPLAELHSDETLRLSRWQRCQPTVYPAGDVGGDVQVSDAFETRWQRPLTSGRTAMVTRRCYIATDRPDGPTYVQCQTEYLICTDPSDPGGTEVWSDDKWYQTVETINNPPSVEDAEYATRFASAPTDDEWRAIGATQHEE